MQNSNRWFSFARAAATAFFLATFYSTAFAQVAQPAGEHVYIMAPSKPVGIGLPQIVGGKQQDAATWPATLRYLVNGSFYCTSTIVGRRSVITAGHCLVEGARARIEFGNGTSAELACSHHPQYRLSDLRADVAMCLSPQDFPLGFLYENLDLRITRARINGTVFLLGYGCRAYPGQPGSGQSGQLYGGLAPIVSLPERAGEHFRTSGQVGICPGDSGGSVFALNNTAEIGGPRSIIGINSGYVPTNRISALTPLFGDVGQFIRDWADDHNVRICGVHANTQNCRERFLPE